MAQRKIIILGAGIMQLPALRIARDEGLWTIAFDGNPDALGKDLCDEFHVIDISDKEAVLEGARAVDAVGGIFTAGTDFSASVAYTAEHLGLPGIDHATAMRATDKFVMREALASDGVAVPRYCLVTSNADGDRDGESAPDVSGVEALTPPLVIKPVDNMGARGVARVDEVSAAVEAVRSALPFSRTGRVIVEELIPGREYSLDAIIYRGHVRVCGVGDRHIRFPPYFVEVGHTIPTELSEKKRGILEEAFKRAIRSIGIDNGAAKGDIFLVERDSGSGPSAVVGEIAARLSGGYMSGWTYPYASGVESTRAAIRIAMGQTPDIPEHDGDGHCAERAVLSIDGQVRSFEGLDEAHKAEFVKNVFILREPGTRVRFPRNNVEKAGNVIAAAPSREEATSAAERAVAAIVPRLAPADTQTFCYLFVDPCPHPAYRAFSREQAALVAELPPLPDHTAVFPGAAPNRPPKRPPNKPPAALAGWKSFDAPKNWSYESFAAAAARFLTYAHSPPSGAGLMALRRGGVQGLLFLVDTLTEDGTWLSDLWRHYKLPESPSRYFCL